MHPPSAGSPGFSPIQSIGRKWRRNQKEILALEYKMFLLAEQCPGFHYHQGNCQVKNKIKQSSALHQDLPSSSSSSSLINSKPSSAHCVECLEELNVTSREKRKPALQINQNYWGVPETVSLLQCVRIFCSPFLLAHPFENRLPLQFGAFNIFARLPLAITLPKLPPPPLKLRFLSNETKRSVLD